MRPCKEVSVIVTSFLFCAGLMVFLLHTVTTPQVDLRSPPPPTPVLGAEAHMSIVVEGSDWPHLEFRSSPLQPPLLNVSGQAAGSTKKHIFTIPRGGFRESGRPIIYTLNGDLVYVDETHSQSTDFSVQQYHGQPRLVLWDGLSTEDPTPGHGYGTCTLLNEKYQQMTIDLDAPINANPASPPGSMDFHEHFLTEQGTLLVTAYNNTPWDLSPIRGPEDGWLASSMLFEIDIASGSVLYSWEAAQHIPLSACRLPLVSYMGDGTAHAPYDYFHINSIEDIGQGRLLVNSRHTWSSYIISRETGAVLEEIKGNDLGFRWAHHARAHDQREDGGFHMTLFDNHHRHDEEENDGVSTRGLLIDVPAPHHNRAPKILTTFDTTFFADSQGSLQRLSHPSSGTSYFLGGGRAPAFVEFDSAGRTIWEARFAEGLSGYAYRAFRDDWVGTPVTWDPLVALEMASDEARVFVSWNGATEVEAWHVYVNGEFKGIAEKKAFETLIHLPQSAEGDCVIVAAVQDGEEIRSSGTQCFDRDQR